MKYVGIILLIVIFFYLGNRLIMAAAKSRARVLDYTKMEEPAERYVIRMAYEERNPSSQVAEKIRLLMEEKKDVTVFYYEASASEVRQMLFDEQADVIIINGEKPKWLKNIVCRRIKTEPGLKNVTILWRKYKGKERRKMRPLIRIIDEGNLYEQKET